MLPKCEACGASVANLAQHMAVCSKREKDAKPKAAPKKVMPPIVEPVMPKRHAGGRPKKHDTCRLCGQPHHAHGLCKAHYAQERNA